MKRFPFALAAFALLGLATQSRAACGWFGTQLECDVGRRLVTIGTQKAAAPGCIRPLGALSLQGCVGLPDGNARARPVALEVQNVGVNPDLCRRFGNETYCY